MALFSLRNFQSEVARRNLARPTRFEVMIPIPSTLNAAFNSQENKLISLFCESTALPPQIIGVRQQRLYGPVFQRPFGVEYGGEGLPMSFYLDQQMDIKAFFDAWISKIVDPKQFFVYYPSSYTVDIVLYQLNEQNNTTYSVVLESAFPRSVTLVELSHSSQNQVSKLNVNFAFRKWRSSHRSLSRMSYPAVEQSASNEPEVFKVNPWKVTETPIPPRDTRGIPTQSIGDLLGPF